MRIEQWSQMVTVIGLLIGLGLVVYELRQSHTLARAQISSDTFNVLDQHWLARLSENFGDVYAKACLSPDELTAEERTEVNAYNVMHLQLILRLDSIDRIASFGYDLERIAEDRFRIWFESKPGIEYYQTMKANGDLRPDWIERVGDRVLSEHSAFDCERVLQGSSLRSQLAEM